MWTRQGVKKRGKKAFTLNYWKCVLVAVILSMIVSASGSSFNGGSFSIPAFRERIHEQDFDVTDPTEIIDDITDPDSDFYLDIDPDDKHDLANFTIGMFIVLFVIVLVLSLFISAIVLAVKYFLLIPFEYGCRKFFRKNLEEPAKLKNLVYVFDSHYKNVVKTAFLRDLFIFLWSLLFLIPGIIKSYQWRLVPYIMSENPTMNYKDALAESRRLMHGNKWKSFLLDLSFIGWDILSLFTWGFLGVFYVEPYKASTDAALYETLKYGIDAK